MTENERKLREALEAAKAKLQQQDEILRGLSEESKLVGTVVDAHGDRMIINAGGQYECLNQIKAKVGDSILVLPGAMIPYAVLPQRVGTGPVATVTRVTPKDSMAEVEIDGAARAVRFTGKVEEGDRVALDGSMSVILTSFGKRKAAQVATEVQRITWDDVGGQEEAKAQLREAIEMPVTNARLFEQYGKRPVRGVLMYGPPGNGKTLLAKAAATALADVHGHNKPQGFIYVKGPELLSKWVGETEQSIRTLFITSREHKKKHGYPALIFIDEAEAVFGDRAKDRGINSSTVPQFLAEMDGLEDSGAMFILATNRPEDLDPAVLREGRVDRKIKVSRPDRATAEKIIKIHLKNRPTTTSGVASKAADEVFDPARVLAKYGNLGITLGDAVSGAMLYEIVEQASTAAMMRDIKNKARACSGINNDDVTWAVGQIQAGMKDLDHRHVAMDKLKESNSAAT